MHLVFGIVTTVCAATAHGLAVTAANDRTFDYVVIGGGTAGLVVAARLSEDPQTTVAVIEAGIHHVDEPLIDTPEFFGQAIGNPAFDWRFVTVPQTALDNAVLPQPRGKMLGGSTGLNFLAWSRGSAAEYDAWETLGATGWNWKTLLPYMKKTEAASPQRPQDIFPGASEVSETTYNESRGRSGPVQSSFNVLYTNITGPYVEAINALGISTNSDPYTGNATGIYNSQMAIDRVKDVGKRSYAANTYLNLTSGRPNIAIFTSTQATKINLATGLFQSVRATGIDVVAVNTTGITGTIRARKEVILSAGTIQTPQVLELSGIGNRHILQAAGIRTIIDLPGVGENLQDQTLVTQDFEILDTFFTYDALRNNPSYFSEQQEQYARNATGIFASAQFALAFPTLKSVVPPALVANLQSSVSKLGRTHGSSPLTRAQYAIQSAWMTADDVAYLEYIMFPGGGMTPLGASPNATYLTIYGGLMHPFSRGSVHINTSHPLTQPRINPSYVDNNIDLQLALESTKFVRKISETEPLASFVIDAHQPPSNLTGDAAWLEYVKASIGPIYHPVGTAAMVPREIGGVVNPRTLKVYGTSNLRVVDASLLPLLVATHPQATVYAIAERASDIIKGLI